MNGKHLGNLQPSDPLHHYLKDNILPQLGANLPQAQFSVQNSESSKNVYLYTESQSGIQVIGKFYPDRSNGSLTKGEIEFRNLVHLRNLSFDKPPHYVVKPLGFNKDIGNVLVMEYLEGDTLSSIINSAVYQKNKKKLYRKLTALAHFLAELHNHTANATPVQFDTMLDYMQSLITVLHIKRDLPVEEVEELTSLLVAWQSKEDMYQDSQVLVHGDVTPANFLFGHGPIVLAIDLERMQWADRVFDLGRLSGELAHFFFLGTGSPEKAEPFIGHFLWEYSRYFPDQKETFRAITQRLPFYMGMTLLRIGRNWWISPEYRPKLINRAKQILRSTHEVQRDSI
ncbi:aminoglycoside phosphotransferase family protein [Desulfogranum japonicum]|uniref:aminoglycoside phosphotransferase family protein n=1 Tax=Desulfogranum japonicum TaxID=231447 RepID=UPI0004070483|nr:aminoglycoside phosphotransferase family protein [Desulfogranum japonicum]